MTSAQPHPVLQRVLPWTLALGLALWADLLFSVGWTFEECLPQSGNLDGAGDAIYGLPFPYRQKSSVFSAEEAWIPWIYFLNIALLTGIAWGIARFANRHGRPILIAWVVGAALFVTGFAVKALMIGTFMWSIDSFRGGYGELSLTDLRPVGTYFDESGYECIPSPFWFPAHRR